MTRIEAVYGVAPYASETYAELVEKIQDESVIVVSQTASSSPYIHAYYPILVTQFCWRVFFVSKPLEWSVGTRSK